ncbi:MAG: helix-turn-helix transcriptional regulator [Phycisphaerales bacterium]|nr:helix-turn-helix transcriptional regulator [Phycisphaerales bacterium]
MAKNLRRSRRARGLTQEELADRAGVYRNYIGMLERAENAATVDMLEKLADVLEIDPMELLDRRP